MKRIIQDYFTFSRKEAYISVVLVIIIAIFIALPYYNSNKMKKEPIDSAIAAIASISLTTKDSNEVDVFENKYPSYSNKITTNYTITPFEFDPNLIDETGWHKLGLPDKTIKTILNYRNKGGSFRTAEDIRKIWGLKKEDADILVPYITIAAKESFNKNNSAYPYKKYEKPLPQVIDINTATLENFRALPAVGNIAYKIINYRERLGGFISINQIKETYNLTDSIYQAMLPYLKISTTNIQKLNINVLTDFELGKHPYISKDIAKAIEIYRKQHGNYNKIEDIKKIVFIKQTTYQKIAPYITVE